MAEAAVEDSVTNRFFCHICSIEITRVSEDYTCPTCNSGFIEEIDSTNTSSDEPSDDHSDDEMDELAPLDVFNQFGELLFGLGGGNRVNHDREQRNQDSTQGEAETGTPGSGRRYRVGMYATHGLRPRARSNLNILRCQYGRNESHVIPVFQIIEDFFALPGMEQFRDRGTHGRDSIPIEHMIQDFIVSLTGVGWGPVGPGGRGNGPVFFLGNPGDYAWGREGLDAIVTQLLNQMDVTGPPPLDKEKIREIPVTVIGQEQVDSNLQCSVCWEDFKAGESVRKLECDHFYHESCIIPWLELHGTCPICRKSLSNDQEEKTPLNTANNSSTMPDLAALLRAATADRTSPSASSSTSPSASSSSASSTATSNTNSSNGRRQPPPPSDFDVMDYEFD